MYDRGIGADDHSVQGDAFTLSSDAGDGGACSAGHPVSCFYVYVCVGAILYAAEYFAGGGRCDVDDGDLYRIHVGVPDWHGLLFQQRISFGTDRYLDRHDDRLDVPRCLLLDAVSQGEMGKGFAEIE